MRKRPSFSYKINYNRKILTDMEAIEAYNLFLQEGLLSPTDDPSLRESVAWYLFGKDPDRPDFALGEMLGLAKHDMMDLLCFCQQRYSGHWIERTYSWNEWPDEVFDAAYNRGVHIYSKLRDQLLGLFDLLPTEAEAKKARSRAKASLARHRRNKERYGD